MHHAASDSRASNDALQSAPGPAEATLEELIADPMTALLWRRDGLESARARAIILELRERVRRTRCATRSHANPGSATAVDRT
jgi:hypothetical protein